MNNLFKRKDSLLEDIEFQLRTTAKQRAETIDDETLDMLDTMIKDILRNGNNLLYVHGVLDGLLARLSEYKTMMMNDAMLHALGYTLDEVVGTDYLTTFVPEGDREKLLEVFETLVTQRKAAVSENRVLASDGRELLVEWHGRPILGDNGEPGFFFGL